MKKFIKLLTLSLALVFLAACSTEPNKEETTTTETPEETSVVETTQAPESDKEDKKSEEGSNQEDQEDEANTDEANEDSVTFKFYVHGEEVPELAFAVNDVDGKSIKEVMENQEDLPFKFNEEEGVVDSINDIENNYDTWETWAYLYNGLYAELGIVSQKLEAGDEISWYYGTVDEIPVTIIPAEDNE